MLELRGPAKRRLLSDSDIHAGFDAGLIVSETLSAASVILARDPHRSVVAADSWNVAGADEWVERELTSLVDLDDDWDGYGAFAPTAEALREAAQFLQIWRGLPRRPAVTGSTEGGVLLEWAADDVELVLEFEDHGEVSAYVRIGQTELEGPVHEHQETVRVALARLATAT